MPLHFEELWTECEILHKDIIKNESAASILDELLIKTNLYKALDQKTEIPSAEQENIKSRIMGEMLLTLTKLSLKDNINVYDALSIAMQHRSIDIFNQKY